MSYYHVNEADGDISWENGLRHFLSKYLASSPMWPVGALCAGPYSPFALEKRYPGQWREAFEDLMSTEVHGTPTRDPSVSVDWMPRADWLEFMGSNGLLMGWRVERDAHILRFFNSRDGPDDRFTVTSDELTDHFDFGRPCEVTGAWSCSRTPRLLDAYVGLYNGVPEQVVSPSTALVEAKNASPAPVSLLSELTTTERVTMPDGAVVEKRVLKKRFADGREEEAEAIEKWWDTVPKTSLSTPAEVQSIPQSTPSRDSNGEMRQREDRKGSKGWFWS